MLTVSLPVAIHHAIVDSGPSKNPANWRQSRRIGSARRHSGFAASRHQKAHRSSTARARSSGAQGYGGCRDEDADHSRLDSRLSAHRRAKHRVGCAGHRGRAERFGLGRGDCAAFARRARVRQAGHRAARGNTRFGFTPNTKISVDAESVICRVSNVDITSRSCELNFGARKRTLTGREANEVGATMAAAGIPSEGAAGSSIESVSKLRCTIDPNEIMQKAGGGAQCNFETGQ